MALRVLVVVNDFPALSETFVLDQATGLIDRGLEVAIFANQARAEGSVHPEVAAYDLLRRTTYSRPRQALASALSHGDAGTLLAAARAAWRRRRTGGATGFPRRVLALAALLDRFRPDAVLCHFGPNGDLMAETAAARRRQTPFATFFHGYDISQLVDAHGPSLYARLFRAGDLFLPVTEAFRARLERLGAPPAHVRLHRMGIRLPDPPPPVRSTRAERDGFHLVSVGRLVEKKGYADAIRALALARATPEGAGARLTIIGEGPLRASLQDLAASLGVGGAVALRGAMARSEVLAQLAASDAFILPSVVATSGDSEGSPVAISEAMSLRLPVVATRHGGIPELVADGQTGVLADERDPPALAAAILSLLRDPERARAMGEAGYARVDQYFNRDRWNDTLAERVGELAVGRFRPD